MIVGFRVDSVAQGGSAPRSDTITECRKVSIEASRGPTFARTLAERRLGEPKKTSPGCPSTDAWWLEAGYKLLIAGSDRSSKKGGVRYVALGSKLPVIVENS
jgi:hypothetical protein